MHRGTMQPLEKFGGRVDDLTADMDHQ